VVKHEGLAELVTRELHSLATKGSTSSQISPGSAHLHKKAFISPTDARQALNKTAWRSLYLPVPWSTSLLLEENMFKSPRCIEPCNDSACCPRGEGIETRISCACTQQGSSKQPHVAPEHPPVSKARKETTKMVYAYLTGHGRLELLHPQLHRSN